MWERTDWWCLTLTCYSHSPENPAVPEANMCRQHFSLEQSGQFSTGTWWQSAHFPEDFQNRSGPPRFMSCQRLSQDVLARYDQNPYAAVHVPTIIHADIYDVALVSAVGIHKGAFGATTWSTDAMGWKHCHTCADVSHLSLADQQHGKSSVSTGQWTFGNRHLREQLPSTVLHTLPSQKGLWARASARSERRTNRSLFLAGWHTLVCSFPDHAADRTEACSHLSGMRKRSARGLPAADRLRPSRLGSDLARPACRINHEGHGDTGCMADKQDLSILSSYV